MAAASRGPERSVAGLLFETGHDFDFFQAVRLLGRILCDRRPVGEAARPETEVARFVGRLSLSFPPSSIHQIEEPAGGLPPRVTVAFLGLFGTQGVLPHHYTERMIARRAARDHALAAFLDLFNHRFVSLFYRAWAKHHLVIGYEQAAASQHKLDPFSAALFDLIGFGTAGLREQLALPAQSLLRYAGLLRQRPHSASALMGILRDYFSVEVAVIPFIGAWYSLADADRCYLRGESLSNQLGIGAIAGDAAWDPQGCFRLRLGPLSFARFRQFLPDSDGSNELTAWTRLFVGQALQFEIQPVLAADEVPWCRLDDTAFDAPRLGWCAWLKTEPFTADAGDAIFAYAA